MKNEEYIAIINYAIDREVEAIDMYLSLSKQTKSDETARILVDLALMEEGHKRILQDLLDNPPDEMVVRKIQTLNMFDYETENEISETETVRDIYIKALQKEKAARELYNQLASQTEDKAMNLLFRKLSQDEAAHQLLFEQLLQEEPLH